MDNFPTLWFIYTVVYSFLHLKMYIAVIKPAIANIASKPGIFLFSFPSVVSVVKPAASPKKSSINCYTMHAPSDDINIAEICSSGIPSKFYFWYIVTLDELLLLVEYIKFIPCTCCNTITIWGNSCMFDIDQANHDFKECHHSYLQHMLLLQHTFRLPKLMGTYPLLFHKFLSKQHYTIFRLQYSFHLKI